MLMLVAIGIGAYWFMTRRATAGPVYSVPRGAGAAQTNGGAVTGQLISQGSNLIGQLFKQFSGSSGSSGYSVPAILPPDYAPINLPAAYNSDSVTSTTDMWGLSTATGVGLGYGF